jgi:hypothetical protein
MIKIMAMKALIRASKRHKAIVKKIITKIHSQKQCLIYVGGKINKSKYFDNFNFVGNFEFVANFLLS